MLRLELLVPAAVLEKGRTYYHLRRVREPRRLGSRLAARVEGQAGDYRTVVDLGPPLEARCSCPSTAALCSHAVALLTFYEEEPERIRDVAPLLRRWQAAPPTQQEALLQAMLLGEEEPLPLLAAGLPPAPWERGGAIHSTAEAARFLQTGGSAEKLLRDLTALWQQGRRGEAAQAMALLVAHEAHQVRRAAEAGKDAGPHHARIEEAVRTLENWLDFLTDETRVQGLAPLLRQVAAAVDGLIRLGRQGEGRRLALAAAGLGSPAEDFLLEQSWARLYEERARLRFRQAEGNRQAEGTHGTPANGNEAAGDELRSRVLVLYDLLERLGRAEQALDLLRRESAQSPELLELLVAELVGRGQLAEAEERVRDRLAQAGFRESLRLRQHLAELLLEKGRPPDALVYLAANFKAAPVPGRYRPVRDLAQRLGLWEDLWPELREALLREGSPQGVGRLLAAEEDWPSLGLWLQSHWRVEHWDDLREAFERFAVAAPESCWAVLCGILSGGERELPRDLIRLARGVARRLGLAAAELPPGLT